MNVTISDSRLLQNVFNWLSINYQFTELFMKDNIHFMTKTITNPVINYNRSNWAVNNYKIQLRDVIKSHLRHRIAFFEASLNVDASNN